MTNPYQPLAPARVEFDARGTPRSPVYDDVYHTGSGAFGQAEHVFLRGNRLPSRWRGRSRFTVCETGFGLGRNFLALWQAWRTDPHRCARLHVVSFEAHPFSRDDLAEILLPGLPLELATRGRALAAQWPPLLPGLHRLEFDAGALTLTLAFGPVRKLARQIDAGVDAYFLDGFSPAKNPEMWTPELFGQLVRLANQGATAASWCCASRVRKELADAGFLVDKAPGFGSKREMMVAELRPSLGRRCSAGNTQEPVLVVGGGIAGAGVAHCLGLRGHDVLVADPVFDQGRGASQRGHLAAALTPLISRDDNARARLTRAGVASAMRRWAEFTGPARPVRCGTLELALSDDDERDRLDTLAFLAFPPDWARWVRRDEACSMAGVSVAAGGVFFADGQLVRPEPLIEALLDDERITCAARRVDRIERDDCGAWRAMDRMGMEIGRAPVMVLANASQARKLLASTPYLDGAMRVASMEDIAGQVSYFDAGENLDARVVIGGNGYWLPAVEGLAVAGGTYAMDARQPAVTALGHREIAGKVAGMLGLDAQRLFQRLSRDRPGWAGQRAVAAGRLPVVGRVPGAPGLWAACGYGSRGLTWSALAGDIIAAGLDGEPMPLERDLLGAIAPA